MFKVKNEQLARSMATKNGLLAGMSVFDGFYYVGNRERLERIGCINIR